MSRSIKLVLRIVAVLLIVIGIIWILQGSMYYGELHDRADPMAIEGNCRSGWSSAPTCRTAESLDRVNGPGTWNLRAETDVALIETDDSMLAQRQDFSSMV